MPNYGYHLTTKNSLYGIKKNGLVPKIGRRSYSVREQNKLLYFFLDSKYINYWNETLYKNFFFYNNMPYDNEVAVLKFPIDDIDYVKRSNVECITEEIVPANSIVITPIEDTSIEYRLSDLDIELKIDEAKLKAKLEALELFKNITYIDPILFTADINENRQLILDKEMVSRLKSKINTQYDDIIWGVDLREKVNDIFYTIIESDILYKYDVSEEWLLDLLLRMEHERQQEFNKQLLDCCHIENGYYLVPAHIANEMIEEHESLIYNDFLDISLDKKSSCAETIAKILNEIKEQNRNDNLLYLKK